MGSSGLFGDAVSQSGRSSRHHTTSRRHSHKKRRSRSESRSPPPRSRSRSESRSRSRSPRSRGSGFFGGEGSSYRKNNGSRGSFFGLGGNNSRSSLFGNRRPSYYKRSPREGFLQRCLKQLKRLLRDLQHYAKRHPWKVFFLVIVPLVTGGALTALLARFGLRIPPSIERMLGMAKRAATGDPFTAVNDAVRMAGEYGNGNGSNAVQSYVRGSRVERGRSGDMRWERKAYYDDIERESRGGLVEGIRNGVSKFFS
ncbi:hypothetical protein MKX08_010356 [Trichoderma sp. CBMAI-0020]|nr:hypothetical protein MKX08_010356 [Trichoderma sp. CBMAI-0020]